MTLRPYDPGAEQRLRRLVDRTHQLGPVALLHLLRELADDDAIEHALKRYARLDPEFIRGMGGECFPSPINSIGAAA